MSDSGAIVAGSAIVFGTSIPPPSTGTGAIVAGSAEVLGRDTPFLSGTGAVVAGSARVNGAETPTGRGVVFAGSALVFGRGTVTTITSIGTGTIVADSAIVTGTGTIAQFVHTGQGAIVSGQAKVFGVGVGGGIRVALTCDGCQPVMDVLPTQCCPLPPCGFDTCCYIENFLQLLPSGPLWDYWKAKALSYFQGPNNPILDTGRPPFCDLVGEIDCPSVVLHAIYTVFKLKDIVDNALWPAFRESDPQTAVATLDGWIAQMQWEDCYRQACRPQIGAAITPYEILTACGPTYCDFALSPTLDVALKHNILRALSRANMGVIRNLCGINWIIEPLATVLTPLQPYQPNPSPPEMTADTPCQGFCPTNVQFLLSRTSDTFESPATVLCSQPTQVDAFFGWECLETTPMGLPAQIWPGVIAAECIVRSLLPPTCPSNIIKVC